MNETWLLLGAPGVGKSTFSHSLRQRCANLQQFSVRLFTARLLEEDSELGHYLRDHEIVKPRVHMPDAVVEQIFAEFLKTVSERHFLIIEGYPINHVQFLGMLRQLANAGRRIEGILILVDAYERIRSRVESRRICPHCEQKSGGGVPVLADAKICPFCGGALIKRAEDDPEFFQVRYRMFLEEKERICQWFPKEVIHIVNIDSCSYSELIQEWVRKCNGSVMAQEEV